MTISTSPATPAGTHTITVKGAAGTIEKTALFTLDVNEHSAPDFDFSLNNSGNINARHGAEATNVISASLVDGIAQNINLSIGSIPSDVDVFLTPDTAKPPFNSTLKIIIGNSTPSGNYTISVLGSNGTLNMTTSFVLSVTLPEPFDFSLSLSPESVTVEKGGNASAQVSAALIAGEAQNVTFSCPVLPVGICSF